MEYACDTNYTCMDIYTQSSMDIIWRYTIVESIKWYNMTAQDMKP